MSEDRSEPTVNKDGGRRFSWLEKIRQAFIVEPEDDEQLVQVLRDAQKNNLLDSNALSMIEGVLDVTNMQVRDIMIPRSQMVVIKHDVDPDDFLPTVLESAHSRFPVIGDTRDEIIGILLAKDLLAHFGKKEERYFDIRDLLRQAIFVPESKRLNVLLNEFRANRNHMAIVVDEYGGIAGLVTIEDVLEQIVGDIIDEHDIEDDIYIVKHSEVRFTAKAITPIDEFNQYFSEKFKDNDFDTIGGLLTHEFGRMPKRGEVVTVGRYKFKILRADSRRIYLLQITLIDSSENSKGKNDGDENDNDNDVDARSVDVA
ncbi:MAG: HlyC/CorC family transporter [Thiohalomonadales bacterium]